MTHSCSLFGVRRVEGDRKRVGVPTQYLHFPDENHWILKPQNSVKWYATVKAWMAKGTKAK